MALHLVPKDKHDLGAVDRAKAVGFPGLNAVLPELLEWVQDPNWPITEPMAAVLCKADVEIVPHIRTVLEGADAEWKYWIIELVLKDQSHDVVCALRPEIERLVTQPTRADQRECVDQAAKALLALISR